MRSLAEYLKLKKGLRKLLIAGPGAVGKTSLLKVLSSGKPLEELARNLEYHRTMFLEYETIDVDSGRFMVYDVSGQLELPIHALRELKDVIFPKIDLVLLVFAADNLQSLVQLNEWFQLISSAIRKEESKNNETQRVEFVLIKNKIDLTDSIDDFLVNQVRKNPNVVNYFEISCKTGEGVEALLKWLIEHLLGNS